MEKIIETLVIDIETTGLPFSGADYEKDYEKFPRIVELGFKINDEPVVSYIINQEGFVIPENVIKIHGITNDMASASAMTLASMILILIEHSFGAKLVIGHNIYFETSIIKANVIRIIKEGKLPDEVYAKINELLDKEKRIDTVKKGIAVTRKWSNLSELYWTLFKKEFNRHRAADDVQACYECYVELKKRGLA